MNPIRTETERIASERIVGRGEMAQRVRDYDWASTPLGPIADWSRELLTCVNLTLASPSPARTMWGPDFILIYNDAYRVYPGPRHPYALGKPARAVYGDASWRVVGPLLETAMATGETLFQEKLLVPLPDADALPGARGLKDAYLNYSFIPVYEDGRIVGLFGDVRDVTGEVMARQRSQAADQAELEQASANERRLQLFVDSIPTLAWIARADGWITWYNRGWYVYTGKTPEEMEGWGWQSVHDAAQLPSVMERWTASIQTGQPFEMIFPLRGADGVLRPFLTRIRPLRDETGAVVQWFGVNTEIDELQRTRQALEESERQATRVLKSIGDAVIVTDAETRIRQMNPVAETLTGWSIAEAEGKTLRTVFRIVDESTDLPVESPADKVIRTQAVVGLANHTVLIAKHGGRISIDDSAAPIRDDRGALSGIVLVFRDIAERRRAERERETLDERLQLALSAANGVGIWDWDVLGDRVYTDEHFARMYGVSADDSKRGMALAAFLANIHIDDVMRVTTAIYEAIRTGDSFTAEYRLLQADGTVCWVMAKGHCSYGDDGLARRFPGMTFDITERVNTEEALRRSEERLRVAMETARLGSFELDLATGQMEPSILSKANFGREEHEPFTYKDLVASVHADDRERMVKAVEDAVATGEPYRCEYRTVWPDGSIHWMLASGSVSYGPKGEALRLTGVSMDSTERHLAQAALMQTEKLAAVGRLAASIAHEINNPLESVTNLLYLARRSDSAQDVQEYLATAERELRRVSVISNQTLRFYRQSTKAKPVTCDELFESVLSIYQGRLVNSNIQVRQHKRTRRPVECFDGEIRQVLNNLVGNAIDAMHPLGGTLRIRSRDTHDWKTGRPGLALTVADNGAGIPPMVLKHIFEAFYTTKGIGGTGLGLWVSKEIIDRHKGALRVRSSQGESHRGTVFVLFLPYEAATR